MYIITLPFGVLSREGFSLMKGGILLTEWFIDLLKIVLINLILSGDNAVVIAMACKNLKKSHRQKAIWLGTAGAVLLRLLLTAVAVILLRIPYLQALGSFLLLYIAIKILTEDSNHDEIRASSAILPVVWTIIVADFIMSLDNVLAIAAISNGSMLLLMIGIAMSIPIIIWGSHLILGLLHRYSMIMYIGAAILAYTAGDMLISDPRFTDLMQTAHHSYLWFIPVLYMVITFVVSYYFKKS